MSFESSGRKEPDDAFTISEMIKAYRVSRSRLYTEIRAGRLRVMKVGARSIITASARRDWERSCEALPLRPAREKKSNRAISGGS